MRKGKPLILCVDDDPDFLESIKLVLESNGYAVETAGSAEDGLRAYQDERPDLLIVDLMMEEVDSGTSFVKDLKALGPPPPIYMLSSVGDGLNLVTDYNQLGLSGVLQKPIDSKALLSALKAKLKKG